MKPKVNKKSLRLMPLRNGRKNRSVRRKRPSKRLLKVLLLVEKEHQLKNLQQKLLEREKVMKNPSLMSLNSKFPY
jgi:hypothetical protein